MVSTHLRAGLAFIVALLRPNDWIESECDRGHGLLEGWETCPECELINQVSAQNIRHDSLPIKVLLYCFEGSHRGELLRLVGREEILGTRVHYSKVLTTKIQENTEEYFRVLLNQPPILISESAVPFQMNGVDAWKESILDFDEVELLGNRFLVLDLQSFSDGSLTCEAVL